MSRNVSIVVPCYNEVNEVENTVQQLTNVMKNHEGETEIIMVNDCSTDGTGDVLNGLSDKITVINNDRNLGYGGSLKRGFRKAKFDTIVITDADGTYPNDRIPELVSMMDESDMVVGARVGKNVKIPLIRRPAKWFITLLAIYLSGVKIPDLNSGLRVMKKDIINRFMNIFPNGFSFTTTITLAMLTNNYAVKFEPISYFSRVGQSSIRPIHDTINFIQLIFRTVMYFKPLKVFLPFAFIFLFASISVLVYSLVFMDRVMDVTVMSLFVCSVQCFTIGLLADLVVKK